jgi:hypothetical protein
MNLSYVEQYFADLLSVLQMRNQESQKIDLISHAIPNRPYPQGFVNSSRSIPVSPNIWFVGTANRDETTKDIADKTYDRAHILELPERHPPASDGSKAINPPLKVSFRSFQAVVRKSIDDNVYQGDVKSAWNFLEGIRPFMNRRFGIGYGSRLEKQVEQYLPIIRACGGNWAEAVDDILAMRILRKIRDRYEIQNSDLEELHRNIEVNWKKNIQGKLEVDDGLSVSINIIKDEQNKKRNRLAEEQAI